eukprot:gene14758-17437_t
MVPLQITSLDGFNQPDTLGLLSPNITSLSISPTFSGEIVPGALTTAIKHLKLGHWFQAPLLPNTIPTSVTHLVYSTHFNHPLTRDSLHAGLTHLTFGWEYQQPILPNTLPATLTSLTFGDKYNLPLEAGCLPTSLVQLTMGAEYNQPFAYGSLSGLVALTHLVLGVKYNQPLVPGSLPPNLSSLSIGAGFNQPIPPNTLPATLTNLSFGREFNQPLDSTNMPPTILHLQISERFGQPIDRQAFPSLMTFTSFRFNFYVYSDMPTRSPEYISDLLNQGITVYLNTDSTKIAFRLLSISNLLIIDRDRISIIAPSHLAKAIPPTNLVISFKQSKRTCFLVHSLTSYFEYSTTIYLYIHFLITLCISILVETLIIQFIQGHFHHLSDHYVLESRSTNAYRLERYQMDCLTSHLAFDMTIQFNLFAFRLVFYILTLAININIDYHLWSFLNHSQV